MSVDDEMRRLLYGVRLDEKPGGVGTIVLVGSCGETADLVTDRVREVLKVTLAAGRDSWPSQLEWRRRLPDWFLSACAAEMTQEQADRYLEEWREMEAQERAAVERSRRWALSDWLFWMRSSERQWEFWQIEPVGLTVRLVIQVDGWPIACQALVWLLRAAGATEIEQHDGTGG